MKLYASPKGLNFMGDKISMDDTFYSYCLYRNDVYSLGNRRNELIELYQNKELKFVINMSQIKLLAIEP